jgi:hypothetical protein
MLIMKNLIAIRRAKSNGVALIAAGLLTLLLVAHTASAQSVTFDFDTGTPALSLYQGLPVDQTVNGATAHFRDASGAFSVQTAVSLGRLKLSMFAGQFLAPANNAGSVLEIQFSEWVTDVTFPFATDQGPSVEEETPVRLTAYTNSAATPPVGMTNATGVYGGPPGSDTWPMGTLTFHSSVPFNLIRVCVPTIVPPPLTGQATDFCLDTLMVQRAGGPSCTITANSSPGGGGTITGGGGYSAGLTATLSAEANLGYAFANWTQGGTVISSSPSFSFVASADRTLVANFIPAYSISTGASPPDAGVTSGDGDYPSGSSVTVVAVPTAGYGFVNWTQDGSEVTNAASYTFLATADRALVANFSPRLSIARSTPGKLVLAWPASATSYVPQQNTSLDPGTWVEVTNPIDVVDDQYQVLVTRSNGPALYRLYVPY